MINLLASLLSPILSPMGVSEADLIGYLTQLQGYDSGRAFENAGETGSSALLQLNETIMKC